MIEVDIIMLKNRGLGIKQFNLLPKLMLLQDKLR